LARETARTRLLRLAADLNKCETFVENLEVSHQIVAIVAETAKVLDGAHTNARAKEDKKRARTPGHQAARQEAQGGRRRGTPGRFVASCQRNLGFKDGNNCPEKTAGRRGRRGGLLSAPYLPPPLPSERARAPPLQHAPVPAGGRARRRAKRNWTCRAVMLLA
jgi:hypothetical protein